MYIVVCNDVFDDVPSLITIGQAETATEAKKMATKFIKDIFDNNASDIYFEWEELLDDDDNVFSLEDVLGHNYYVSVLEVNKDTYVPIVLRGLEEGFPTIEDICDKKEFKNKEEVIATIKEIEENPDDYMFDYLDVDYDNLRISNEDGDVNEEIVFLHII